MISPDERKRHTSIVARADQVANETMNRKRTRRFQGTKHNAAKTQAGSKWLGEISSKNLHDRAALTMLGDDFADSLIE